MDPFVILKFETVQVRVEPYPTAALWLLLAYLPADLKEVLLAILWGL